VSAGVAVVDDRGATVYGRAEPSQAAATPGRRSRGRRRHGRRRAAERDRLSRSVIYMSTTRLPAPSVVVSACTPVWNVPTDLYGVITGDNWERRTPCTDARDVQRTHTERILRVLCC